MVKSGSDEEDKVPEGAFDPDVPMSEILASIRKSIAASGDVVEEGPTTADEDNSDTTEEDALLLTEQLPEEDVLVLSVRAEEAESDEQVAEPEEGAEGDEASEELAVEDFETLVGLQENAAAISEDLVSLELEDPEGDFESLVATVEEEGAIADEDVNRAEELLAEAAGLETPSLSDLEQDSSLKEEALPNYESRDEQALEEGHATVDQYIAEAGNLSSEEVEETEALISEIDMLKEVGGAPPEMLEAAGLASETDLPEELEGQELETLSLSSLIDEDEIESYLAEEGTGVVEDVDVTSEPVDDDTNEPEVADALASIRQAVEEEVINQDDAEDGEPYSFDNDPRFADVTSSDPRQRSGQDPYLRRSAVDDSDPFAANRVEEAAGMDWETDAQAEAEEEAKFLKTAGFKVPEKEAMEPVVASSDHEQEESSPFESSIPTGDEPLVEPLAEGEAEEPNIADSGGLSAEGAEATSAAFEQLARGITGTLIPTSSAPLGGLTAVEAFAADLMRPMIREWLDEHLPEIVEKLVKAELEERGTGDD